MNLHLLTHSFPPVRSPDLMFICILEFKLTLLVGFVLVPFALWNRTSFLAERVLGSVVSSGIKVMVIAVIVGIGSNFFSDFINGLQGQEVDQIGRASCRESVYKYV